MTDAADWVVDTVAQAGREFGIDVRLIVCMNRHESVAIGQEMMEIAIARQDRGVVGLDLAGMRLISLARNSSRSSAKPARQGWGSLSMPVNGAARAHPVSHRPHWGQAVWDTVSGLSKILRCSRLPRARIAFEVCPTAMSNRGIPQLRAAPAARDVPAGLTTTINTDNTSVSALSLTDELAHAVESIGPERGRCQAAHANSARVAFLPPGDREKLVNRLMVELYPGATKSLTDLPSFSLTTDTTRTGLRPVATRALL